MGDTISSFWGYFSDEAAEGEVPAGYIRLYHYTDLTGAKGIVSSKKIRKSTALTSTDAVFGEGTYLTDKAPGRHSKLNIAKDIWANADKLHDAMVIQGRTDFVFEVIIKANSVQLQVKILFHGTAITFVQK